MLRKSHAGANFAPLLTRVGKRGQTPLDHGPATPIMLPTFCAVEMRLTVSTELHHLMEGSAVLPRERWRVDCTQGRRHLLVADFRLRAGRMQLPVRGIRRPLCLRHVRDCVAQRRQQHRPAAATDLPRDLARRAAAVDAPVATLLLTPEQGAQILLDLRAPVPVEVTQTEELLHDTV